MGWSVILFEKQKTVSPTSSQESTESKSLAVFARRAIAGRLPANHELAFSKNMNRPGIGIASSFSLKAETGHKFKI